MDICHTATVCGAVRCAGIGGSIGIAGCFDGRIARSFSTGISPGIGTRISPRLCSRIGAGLRARVCNCLGARVASGFDRALGLNSALE